MSIESPVGTLDIKNATLRVGKLEVSNIQGVDTALNVTRSNSILVYDDQASATTFNGFTSTSGVRNTASGYLDVAGGHVYWGQKLPNAWTMEFEMDIRSGTNSGPIYANVFSSTNTGGDGYSFTFNDSNDKITLMYDGAVLTETSVPGLFTTSENWQKVVINYERGMITVSLSGSRAFYYNDIEREKPYTTGEYVNVSSSSTDGRKIRGFKVTNGDKWTYSGESNITYTHGSLGIGVVDPTATLDVAGTVNATAFVGDGTLLSNVVNDTDLQSNVTTLRDEMASNTVTLRGDLQSNVTTLRDEMTSNTTTLRGDLQSNVTILRGEMASNTVTLRGDLQSNVTTLREDLQSNVTILRDEMASNTVTLRGDLQSNVTILRDEMTSNTTTLRGDLQSNVTTLRGEMASNTTTLRGDLQSNVTTLRGEMASNTTTLRGDLQSNVTTLRGEMASNTTTLRGDLQSNVTILRGEMTSNTTTLRGDLQSNVTTLRGEMASNTTTLRGDLQSNVTTLRGEMASNTTTLRGDLQSNVTTLRGEMTSNTTTLRGDLQSNVTTLRGEMASNTTTLRGDLQSNVTILKDTAITFTGIKTFQDDVILESNLRIQGDILVANTINMTVSDPILELGSNNQNTGDLGLVMTRHGSSNSNVAIFFDESADVLKLGYTLNGANDSTLELDSNALAVNIQGALTAASLSGDGSGLTSLNASNVSSGKIDNARLNNASTTGAGIVQLSTSTSGTSTTKAATEGAVKAAYDRNSWGSGTFSGIVTVPKLSVSADSNVYFSDTAANYGTSTGYDTFRVGRMNYSPSSVMNGNGAVYVSAGDLSMKAQGLNWAIAEDIEPKGAEIYLEGGRSIKAGQTHGSIYFRTAGTTHEVGSDRMVIEGDTGNVGIGTTDPSDTLHIVGNTRTTGLTYGFKLTGQLDGTKTESWYRLLKDTTGRVGSNGIRTVCKLQISATGLHETVTFDFNQMISVSQTSGCTFNLYGHDHYVSREGVLKLRLAEDSSGDRFLDMYINHDVVAVSRVWTVTLYVEGGSVASEPTTFLEKITTDPLYSIEFDIANALSGVCNNSGQSFIFDQSGNVGIGTSSPAYTLDVHGTSNVGALTATTGTFSGDLAVGTSDLFVDTTTGNVGIGTASPAYTLDVNGDIGISGRAIFPTLRWDVDLTPQSTANFYPVEFRHESGTNGELPPVNFKVYGQSLIGPDSFNENTLIGFARGGGWSDHNPMYDVQISRFTSTEHRFLGIYEGTRAYASGFVIYMRGGYKYGIIADALSVTKYTTAYDTTGTDNSIFGIKNVSGTDVSGTSSNISQLVNLTRASSYERFVQGDLIVKDGSVGIGTASPSAKLHISSGTSGDCVLKIEADTDNNNETDNPRIEFITDGGYNTALVGAGQMPFETANDNALVLAGLQMKLYTGVQDFNDSTGMIERVRILDNGNVGIGTTSPTSKLHVFGGALTADTDIATFHYTNGNQSYLKIKQVKHTPDATNWNGWSTRIQQVTDVTNQSYIEFNPLDGQYATAFGNGSSEYMRIKDGGNVGIGTDSPNSKLDVRGTISTGRNLAREVGTVIAYSSQYTSLRAATNVISGIKNFEPGNSDWLTVSGQRVDAYVVVDLGQAYSVDRMVIYNQNEYANSKREVKGFTLQGSADNSTWTTVLTNECGRSSGHEPNPGWSFRIPASWDDDTEGTSYRYWKFIMNTFHGTDSYGGIMELELYEASDALDDEVSSSSIVAQDVYAETGNFNRGVAIGKGYGGTSTGENNLLVQGNVGIGTVSPETALELHKRFGADSLNSAAEIKFSTNNDSVAWDVGSIRGGIKLNAGGTSNYPGGLVFATKSPGGNTNDLTDKMVIDANGNVGIGTASPSTELEVAGTITIGNGSQLNAIRTDSDGNLQFLRNAASNDSPTITINDDTGNVGVGTTSPGYKLDVNGTVNTSGGIRSYKDGVVAEFQPTTSGSYTLINFHSKVNSGSDKGFILVQDESANSPGSSAEDLRMTIGVHNDFRQSASHSDELWFQGGGRLVYNVGSWDSELDTIIGTAGTGTTGGHEWRVNDSTKMLINHTGNVGIGTTSPGYKLDVNGTVNTGALTATSEVLKLSSGTGTSNAVALSIQNFSSSYTEIENGFGSRIQFRTNRGTSGGSTSQSAEIKGYIYGGAGGSGDYHALDLDAYGDNGSFSRGISIYGKGNGTSILPADVTVHGNLTVDGTVNTGALTATSVSGNGSGLTSLNADNINAGTLTRPINTSTGVFTHVSLGTDNYPTLGGNWLTIFSPTYDGAIGDNHPDPDGGILFANRSGSSRFPWGYYMGVVKDVASTNSTSLRFDIGKSSDLNSQDSTGGSDSLTPYLTIDNGNVGIGKTSPGYKLDVNGTVNTGALTATSGTFSGNLTVIGNQEIRHPTTDSRGYVELRFNNNGPNQGSGAGLLLASDEVASFNPIAIIDTWKSGVSGAPPLVFKTQGTERMRLTDSGNFGIGTTGPTSKLHVYGGSAVIENTGTNIVGLYINNNSTPTTGYSYLLNGPRPGTTTSGAVHFINGSGRTGDGGVNTYTIRNDSGNLRLGNASYSTILEGSVGIGTASPSYNLHVSGTSQFEAEMRWSLGTRTSHAGYSTNKDWYIRSGETAGKVILQDGGGNVGIGTASPGYKLVVAGDIYATGDIIGANGNFGTGGIVRCAKIGRPSNNNAGFQFAEVYSVPLIYPAKYSSGTISAIDNQMWFGFSNYRFNAGYFQTLYRNAEATFSDDRIKTGESLITNATETLLKLKPQTYDKHTFTYDEITDEEYSNVNADGLIYDKTMETWVDRSEYKRNTLATKETHPWIRRTLSKDTRKEAGLIAQDIWYDVPELKYIVNIADDASPAEEKPVSETDDIQQDPDYDAAGWGTTEASVSYTDLISYLIKSIQELNERIKVLENPTN